MEKFLQRKNYQGTFSTSTPEKCNQPLMTNSISDVEASGTADPTSCERPELDSRPEDQDPEETTSAEEKPNLLQEIMKSEESIEQFKKTIQQSVENAFSEIQGDIFNSAVRGSLHGLSGKEDRIGDEDNIEDAKMWAINQK